ncbi:bifunctional oligoribonuclease/PAP phosphatase NrnA [Corynebacterium sp. MSK044]|uniref:DHH family phosphoesterase n=1 Tax=unclassified Corynebacterium TaxID=2624378 RepID=UPI00254C2D5F|nr:MULTISPECIES: bifunctional oligoribonuclease/PAP phosphatase NrnA [unclassified Corynebacterium]MDK8794456.1 bifunctional oligoribonuclease/PAP phosphatase NrnA [Corynebacterium sp. MSK041]MDK8797288.1 bifunctional oligoribonuclease/PAP phosphatase NrnA [Corynebacterium sp. MSK044]
MAGDIQAEYRALFGPGEGDFAGVAAKLRAADEVHIVTHIRPDADAVGSALGLKYALDALGVPSSVYIGQKEELPENIRTVPGVGTVALGKPLPSTGLVVTTDCASLDRTGMYHDELASHPERVVVIDHHASNPGYGALNLVLPSESTTVIIRELLSHMGVELTPDIAYCLYAGLVTDTGSFRWGTARMHILAAELMEHGVDTRAAAMDLMDAVSADDLKLMGDVMAGMETRVAGRYTISVLAIDDAHLRHMNQTAIEAIIEYSRALTGSDIGVVFKEIHPGYWSVSLRSSVVNVADVAAMHGGGGHVPAAGYSVAGAVDAAIDALQQSVSELP